MGEYEGLAVVEDEGCRVLLFCTCILWDFFTHILFFPKNCLILHCKTILYTVMARMIKETPILTGEDAERFVERAERVENMSKEERAANRARLMERVAEANKHIIWCW